MESDLPIQPSSNLRRKLMGHKPPPAAMETQCNIPPRPQADEHQPVVSSQHIRSSSFSNFGRSLSRLLPANRKERGGTLKIYNDGGEPSQNSGAQIFDSSPIKILKFEGNEGDGEELRKVRSWSPAKIARVVGAKDRDNPNESKLKMSNTFQALWDSHKMAKHDGEAHDFSSNPDRFMTKGREWQRSERTPGDDQIPTLNYGKQLLSPLPSPSQEIDATIKRAKQLYEEKKARKDERRSFRESDDYLGVQGINPRTGYPDRSTATSSTGDVLDESMRQKVDEDERRMENARIEYKAALERREEAVRQLESERERRRKEKKDRGQKKKTELKARMRRDGRWKSEENRWSLVIEPDLSPIVQSLAGSPVREIHPRDTNISELATSNSASIPGPRTSAKKEYFGQQPLPITPTRYYNSLIELASEIPLPPSHEKNMAAASTTPRRRYMLPFVDYPTSSPQPSKTRPPSVESLHDTSQRSHLPIKSAKASARPQETNPDISRNGALPIRHRKTGSWSQNLRMSSTETIVHKTNPTESEPAELPDEQMSPIPLSRLHALVSKRVTPTMPTLPPATAEQPFLDVPQYQLNEKDLQENLATAILFLSPSTSTVLSNLQLPQSPKDMSSSNRMPSVSEPPPAMLIDPLTADTPSSQRLRNPQSPPEILQMKARALMPHPIAKGDGAVSTTITPIITTTGFVLLPQIPSPIDGAEDIIETQVSLEHRASQNAKIPTPTFRPRSLLSGSQRIESPTNRAGTDISSMHRPLATPFPTRQLVPRLCRGTLLASGGEVLKSTPMSKFAIPRPLSPSQHQATAQKVGRIAFSQPSPHRPDKVVKARSTSRLLPNLRAGVIRKTSDRKRKIFSRGSLDIRDPFENRGDVEKNGQFLREKIKHAINLGEASLSGRDDGLPVWFARAGKEMTVVEGVHPTVKKMETQLSPQKQIWRDNKGIVFCEGPERKVSIVKIGALVKNHKGVQLSPKEISIDPYNKKPFSPGRRNDGPGKDLPKPSILLEIYRTLKEIIATAWWFISPVFNPRSGLRVRWVRGELTWQDIVLITAATVFGGGTFLVVVVCMKVLGLGVSIMRGMWGFGRWIVGF